MDILKLSSKSRVSVPILTALLNAQRNRYVWVEGGGSVEFSGLMTEAEWSHKVAYEFGTNGTILTLRRSLGPYVQAEKKGRWILEGDRNILEKGSAIEKAVVIACNTSMENGYEEVLTSTNLDEVAVDLMDNDADIEKLTAHDGSPFKQADVIFAVEQWRKVHAWTDYSKMPA
jgi:hypothetical protein